MSEPCIDIYTHDEETTVQCVSRLVPASMRFVVDPYPDGGWRVRLRNEPGRFAALRTVLFGLPMSAILS